MGQEEANDNQGVVNLPAARNPKNSQGGVVDGLLGGNLTDQLESCLLNTSTSPRDKA